MQMEKPKRKNAPHRQRIARIVVISGLVLIIGLLWTFRLRLFPLRLQIANIESITIRDSWSGLLMSDPSPPFTAQYDLTIQDNSLIGTATYSAGYSGVLLQEDVMIPAGVVEAFRRKLNETRIIAGDYTPYFWITDDHPSISIIIETHDETIEIFTAS